MRTVIVVISLIIVVANILDFVISLFLDSENKQKVKKVRNKSIIENRWEKYHEQMLAWIEKFYKLWKKTKKNKFVQKIRWVFVKEEDKSLRQVLKNNFLFWVKLLIALFWATIWAVWFGIYRALAFLGPTGHMIIRYIPYLILVNIYEQFFWPERYIVIFLAISDIFWYFIGKHYSDEDNNYQQHMNKLNILYVSVLWVVFMFFVLWRLMDIYLWFWLPERQSEVVKVVFDWFHDFEIMILKDIWIL